MTQQVAQNAMPWPYGGMSAWTSYPWTSVPSKITGFRNLARHYRTQQYFGQPLIPNAGCTKDEDCAKGHVCCTSAGGGVCCDSSAGGCADPLCGMAITARRPRPPSRIPAAFWRRPNPRRILSRRTRTEPSCPEGCYWRDDLKCCQGKGKACQCKKADALRAENPFVAYPAYGYGYGYGYPWGYGYPYYPAYAYPWWGGYYPWYGGFGFRGHPHRRHHGLRGVPTDQSTAVSTRLVPGPGGSRAVNKKPGLDARIRRFFRRMLS